MSIAAPNPVSPFTPRSSIPTWVAKKAPKMHPAVLAAYTLPMEASPTPRCRRTLVATGSVMPARRRWGT